MKTIRLFAVGLFLTGLFALSGLAQAKVAVINIYGFGDEKAGITKYVAAIKSLNTEFEPLNVELRGMQTKLNALAADIENLKKLAASNPKAFDEKSAQAKIDEAEKIQRDIKFKQEDGNVRLEKRKQAVLAPIMQDIMKAVQDYSKQKSYSMVLEISKLVENGILLGIDEKADITKEFIAYYNARPAGTAATTATPK
jgi:outer membrane protein